MPEVLIAGVSLLCFMSLLIAACVWWAADKDDWYA